MNAVYIMQYPGTTYKYMWQFILSMRADCQYNKIIVPTTPVSIQARIGYSSVVSFSGFTTVVLKQSFSPYN